jgi:hypothetical protein
MTLSELDKWRWRVPWFVFALCAIPWIWIGTRSVEKTKLYAETVVPILSCIATFLYVGSSFRQSRWKKEIRDHVGVQIRQTLIDMVPNDLAVTNDERNELLDREILRELTGVFWEGIDDSPKLQNLKEHFYSNGIVYSTSMDVFVIAGYAGIVYLISLAITRQTDFGIAGLLLISLSLISRFVVLPNRRDRHLTLSREQLDLLQREQPQFIDRRFREIIAAWRDARAHL